MKILNNTHYHNINTKVFNIVPDTNSFSYQSSKRMGYLQRMFFEYEYTKKLGGSSFFYTFTYNDKSIPRFVIKNPDGTVLFNHVCFSYQDIRYITNGKLSKILFRDYGSRLRYFVSCERGDGKGKRGLGNNPHYHFIFFVQPVHDKFGVPQMEHFKPIDCWTFRSLLNELWLGSKSSFVDYKSAKFGIVQPGKFMGLVQNSDAFSYVGKYVIKDDSEKAFEYSLSNYYENHIRSIGFSSFVLADYYKYLTKYLGIKYSFSEYVKHIAFREYLAFKKSDFTNKWSYMDFVSNSLNGKLLHPDAVRLFTDMRSWFDNHYVPWYVAQCMSYYKSECSGKPRMSKNLGEYGLQFITDIDSNPRIVIPTSSKYQIQYPCLFYIRKLYYDTYICPVTGNVLYSLSETGIQLKKNQLSRSCNNLLFNTQQNISFILNNQIPINFLDDSFNYYNLLDSLDIVGLYHTESKKSESFTLLPKLSVLLHLPDYQRILRAYVFYKKVYEFRHFNYGFTVSIDDNLSFEDVLRDYSYFLQFDKFSVDYDNNLIFRCLKIGKHYSSRQIFPFSSYLEWFDLLDLVNETAESLYSDFKLHDFKERSERQKKLKAMQYTPVIPFTGS